MNEVKAVLGFLLLLICSTSIVFFARVAKIKFILPLKGSSSVITTIIIIAIFI